MPSHWLMKSEPSAYSIDDLERDGTTCWDGVRNFEARNFMQEMKKGDRALFYHSSASPAGVAGVMEVVKTAYPDHTAFDRKHQHHDPKSDADDPTWWMVDVRFVERFPRVVPLADVKADAALADMMLIARFRAPSVQPAETKHFARIVRMGRKASG